MGKKEINIFEEPQKYREEILEKEGLLKSKKEEFDGKSLICVFFTSYCGVGCPFCFFHSPNAKKKEKERMEMERKFSKEAVDKFIDFANSANVGYLQISGGGEPFLEKEAILKTIRNVNAERIILVTSGMWAKNKDNAERYLRDLYEALRDRKNPTRLTIRLSVSEYHSIKLEEYPLINLLKIFEEKYSDEKDFTLQLKTFENDNAMAKYLGKYYPGYELELDKENGSDDSKYIKVMPWKYKLTLPSGYSVIVGKSRIFNSSLQQDLNNDEAIRRNVEIYDRDLETSQNNNSTIMYNSDGKKGLDWIVEYNGNVCTWQNRIQDNLLNIYEDDYNTVLNKTLKDILTYSMIDKGSKYRDEIVSEISPKTVALMKSVNIRDYAGTLLFADEKIRLYYTVRVLQDYIKEGKINEEIFNELSMELKEAICMSKEDLIEEYRNSKYSVLRQEQKKINTSTEFLDFLELIKLGHYELTEEQIVEAIKYYNMLEPNSNIKSLDDISVSQSMDKERRLTNRVMTIKNLKCFSKMSDVTFHLCRHGETNWNVEGRIKGQLETANTYFTNTGYSQIEDLIKYLKENDIEAIFTSDLLRTNETSKIINEELHLPIYYCKDLRGWNMGDFQGKSMKEFFQDEEVKKALKDYSVRIPGGESINELNIRLLSVLKKIIEKYAYERVAIISHGAAISNLTSFISNKPYKDVDNSIIHYSNNDFEVIGSKQYRK